MIFITQLRRRKWYKEIYLFTVPSGYPPWNQVNHVPHCT